VDLRHQRRADEPRLIEQPLIVPVRVLLHEHVADGVVLAREQAVQQAQPHPQVVAAARDLGAGRLVVEEPTVILHLHLAARAGAEDLLLVLRAAVDVRAVPPMRVLVHVGRRPVGVGHRRRIDRCLGHAHRPFEPGIVVGERQIVRVVRRPLRVHEPVVHLELDPRRRQHVENRGGLELVAREKRPADVARVRIEQVRGIGSRFGERDVAAEPRAGGTHHGALQVVEAAIHGAGCFHLLGNGTLVLLELRFLGVVQVLLAQLVAHFDELLHRGGARKLVPLFVAGNGVAAHRAHSTGI
jgi:hypothetical protein